jgi:hypothetical protein
MAKIWFTKSDIPPDPNDLKGDKDPRWCLDNLGTLKFWSPLDKPPRISAEESPIPPENRNYKFVIVEIGNQENVDLKPGFYLSSVTPKDAWEKLKS